jgi:hypothetical protein
MEIAIILYCLGNDKRKLSVQVQYGCIFFPPKYFNLQLVESADTEPEAMEGWLYYVVFVCV